VRTTDTETHIKTAQFYYIYHILSIHNVVHC